MTAADRQSHVDLDQASRAEKARRILALIERRHPIVGADLLEVGCGSGWMTAAFARSVGPDGRTEALDRRDQRQTDEGYHFQTVDGTTLPFDDDSFDIVISNHVMEHVGEGTDQLHHLEEIRRVLRPGGVLYLAVPNRWRVVEPHFRLPFLSWLPQRGSNAYLRVLGKGDWYDVVPPSRGDMAELLNLSGLWWEDATLESIHLMRSLQTNSRLERVAFAAPAAVLKAGLGFVPSMIYVAGPPEVG